MPENRKLAAIMFTDIVGYTAMMQKNEQHAISLLERHQAVLESKIVEHHGQLVSYYGDGSLSTFSSVTEALQCAIDIQYSLLKDPKVPLRIGIHTGEIIVEQNKIVGDSVNLASRIQSLGNEGSILFSKDVFEKIKNRQQFKTVLLGSFQLKNVDEPMEIFALANEGINVPNRKELGKVLKSENGHKKSKAKMILGISFIVLLILGLAVFTPLMRAAKFAGKDKSIAVLPFKNLSADSQHEYFSDGITEDIITQLSKIAGLRVISSSSVMQYKNNSSDINHIAHELNVAAVLEGSVRREGNQVRITAQLIDASNNQHIWANNYDRNADEVLAIQSEVAQQIARELDVRLTSDEGRRIQNKATGNPAAYEDYLLARQSRAGESERLLLSAIQKDSTFALAWSALAFLYTKKPVTDSTDRPYYIRKALDAALTAVSYGPDLSETHMILGDVLKTITLNPNYSIRELDKSVKLNPNNADAYVYLAFALSELGRFPEAAANLRKAKQLDPLSQFPNTAWTLYYYYARDAKRLNENLNATTTPFGKYFAHAQRINYFFLMDEYDSILNYRTDNLDIEKTGIALIKTGRLKEANVVIDSLQKSSVPDNAIHLGVLYAWMGDNQKAMKYLDIAYRLFDYGLISVKVNKVFDPLRNEDSFKTLLKKIGVNDMVIDKSRLTQ